MRAKGIVIFARLRVGIGEGFVKCFCHHQQVALVVVVLGCLPRLPEYVNIMHIIENSYEESYSCRAVK